MNEEYIINPNPDFVFRKQIEENIKNNNGYCISCAEQNENTKCVCQEFKDQDYSGFCKCGQYYKSLKPQIVCICGSIESQEQILQIAYNLIVQGYIVLVSALSLYTSSNSEQDRKMMNEVDKAEIEEADLIYIINPQSNIDELTKEQLQWATQLNKKIRFIDEEEIV